MVPMPDADALSLPIPVAGTDGLCFDRQKALRHLRRADPKLAALMKVLGPFTLKVEPADNTFGALAEAIVYQQLSP